MVKFDFSDKVVLVTGGGTGIGEGIALAFADANAQVVIAGRRTAMLERVAAKQPDKISWVQMDITRDDQRHRAVNEIIERFQKIDCLVNNAGKGVQNSFSDMTMAQIENTLEVNLLGTAAMSQVCLPHLIESGGNIINISSVGARVVRFPPTRHSVYAAAKAGVNQLTRTLASELAPQGVRVNAVAPGATASEMADASNPDMVKFVEAGTPMGRFGQPEDIAPLVLFLASDAAHWVTGQIVDSSGGWGLSG